MGLAADPGIYAAARAFLQPREGPRGLAPVLTRETLGQLLGAPHPSLPDSEIDELFARLVEHDAVLEDGGLRARSAEE